MVETLSWEHSKTSWALETPWHWVPDWFKIPTPVGTYNPDWAIVKQDDSKLYLVKETKSTHNAHQRRDNENRKIKCGKAHFDALGVEFGVATTIHEVLEGETAD